MSNGKTRCGFIAIIGAPNAGKSTLLNGLIGHKISIVTHKAQTTRRRVIGITNVEKSQLVFIDTPGIFSATKTFDRYMVTSAYAGLLEADIGLLVVDAAKRDLSKTYGLIQDLPAKRPPLYLVLNKVDRTLKEKLLPIAADLNAKIPFAETFMVSAHTQAGLPDILTNLAAFVPESPWHYEEDQLSNLTQREIAAETVREKLFLNLHDELPYGLTVAADTWEHFNNGSVKISLTIYVERETHKPMVLGHHGQMIKRIGQLAREDLTHLWGHPVHVMLHVKVKEGWTERPQCYADLGIH